MRQISYSEAVQEALREEMERDARVILIGEDIGKLGGIFRATKGLLDQFGPERVIGTPISEAAIVGAAVGASLLGMRPVAEIMYVDFMPIAADQLVNQAAKFRYMHGKKITIPLVVRTQGGIGRSNGAQHSASLEAWFAHIPGLKVVMPSTPADAKGLLKSAIRDDNPVVFIEHKALYATRGSVPEGEVLIPLGEADVKRSGKDVTLIATSMMVARALAAAETLAGQGIDAEVIDPRTLVPLDEECILQSVMKTGRVVIVHEACKRYGIGAEMAAIITEKAFDFLDAPPLRVAGADVPIPYGPLEEAAVPSADLIVQSVLKLF